MKKEPTEADDVAAMMSEDITQVTPAELDVMAAIDGDDLDEASPQFVAHAAQKELTAASVALAAELSLHPLDTAPVNSKIVVVKAGDAAKPGARLAVLMTPNGEQKLDDDDPAHTLAEGARIQKRAEGKFVSVQLSPADDRDPLETATAAEAIARFNQHFHDAQP